MIWLLEPPWILIACGNWPVFLRSIVTVPAFAFTVAGANLYSEASIFTVVPPPDDDAVVCDAPLPPEADEDDEPLPLPQPAGARAPAPPPPNAASDQNTPPQPRPAEPRRAAAPMARTGMRILLKVPILMPVHDGA